MALGVATDEELALMASVLDAYCRKHVVTEPARREDLGAIVLAAFERGARTDNELTEALAEYVRRYGMLPPGPFRTA